MNNRNTIRQMWADVDRLARESALRPSADLVLTDRHLTTRISLRRLATGARVRDLDYCLDGRGNLVQLRVRWWELSYSIEDNTCPHYRAV